MEISRRIFIPIPEHSAVWVSDTGDEAIPKVIKVVLCAIKRGFFGVYHRTTTIFF